MDTVERDKLAKFYDTIERIGQSLAPGMEVQEAMHEREQMFDELRLKDFERTEERHKEAMQLGFDQLAALCRIETHLNNLARLALSQH